MSFSDHVDLFVVANQAGPTWLPVPLEAGGVVGDEAVR